MSQEYWDKVRGVLPNNNKVGVDGQRPAIKAPSKADRILGITRGATFSQIVKKVIPQNGTKKIRNLIIFLFVFFLVAFIWYFYASPESFVIANEMTDVLDDNGNPKKDEKGNVIQVPAASKFMNGFYYWTTLTSTVGFGDICPKSSNAKLLTAAYQCLLFATTMGGVWMITDGKLKKAAEKLKEIALRRGSEPSFQFEPFAQ